VVFFPASVNPFFRVLLLAALAATPACAPDSYGKPTDLAVPRAGAPDRGTARAAIRAELAPFDRYPSSDRFPIVFRFTAPLAPADRLASANFAGLQVNPSRHGSWRWVSDSQLQFEPKEGWRAGEELDVSLRGLVTSDGTQGPGPAFAPEVFRFRLPAAMAGLERCELRIRNRAPLVQYPVVGLRFNYPPDRNVWAEFADLSLEQGDKDEKLQSSLSPFSSTSVEVTGPDLFRPEQPGEVRFLLRAGLPFLGGGTLEKEIGCNLAIDPLTWDKAAEEPTAPAAEPPLVVVVAQAPSHPVGYAGDDREPLVVRFSRAFATLYVPHGKPKGLTIEQGLALEPKLEGVWKTDEWDEDVIRFVPAEPWPIGQPMAVVVDENVFPSVKLKEARGTFETPGVSLRISDARLHTDPVQPSLRQVVATVELSHVPKAGEIERLLSMRMRVEPQKDFRQASRVEYSVFPDPKRPQVFHLASRSIDLPDEQAEVEIHHAAGLEAARGGSPSKSTWTSLVRIPARREIFRVESASLAVVKKDNENLQRIVTLEVTEPVTAADLEKALAVYVLPDCGDEKLEELCRRREEFGFEGAVTDEVRNHSQPLAVTAVPGDEATLPKTFSFTFEAPGGREVFLEVRKGLRSQTGFELAADYRSVQFAQPFPRSLTVMHEGALLSLSGSRQLGVSMRGVARVEYELARILPHDVHHLVTVTSGGFANPRFRSSHIGLDQLAERQRYSESFPADDSGRTWYSTVDFGRFLAGGAAPRGLFVLTVREKEEEPKATVSGLEPKATVSGREPTGGQSPGTTLGSSGECDGEDCEGDNGYEDYDPEPASLLTDSRLVLVTDLGLLVKDTLAGEHTVYVMSFRSGAPVEGATIKLLGQNGAPIFTATSDSLGRVQFPSTEGLKAEKKPLVYVVEKDGDYSFLPFGRNERQLNFSRFETGGVFNSEEAEGLRALVFSDRGIYRPGEEARFGIIVRRRNLEAAGTNLPLELSLRDPRGIEILRRKFALGEQGFEEFRWTSEGALTGTWSLGVYLVRGKKEEKQSLLGSTSFRVDEFQPDKLAVTSRYLDDEAGPVGAAGWRSPRGGFEVKVQNLFGTAAVASNVKGTMLVRPWSGTFDAFPGYDFYSRGSTSALPNQPEDLGELVTDQNGVVRFVPDLSRFSEQAFRLEFAAEAFEKDSGRSVVSTSEALVSSAPHFLGFKADGSLAFIDKGAGRKVSLVAVAPDLRAKRLDGVRLRLDRTTRVSSLVKMPNGTLEYQLTPKVTTVSESTIDVDAAGSDVLLDTKEPGDYRLHFLDASGAELAVVGYLVHGEGNATFLADRAAEVGIRLAKSSVEPDEELEISIDTPYAGSGLITIEREKVYAAQWFQADTLSSVQRIRVPRGIVGNAYVSVAFVRSLESRDIFAPPLSYGVEPFSIARSEYTTTIDLTVPAESKPGREMEVGYRTSNAGRVLVYAVDEGILQFARYKDPQPVASFVPKRALEVETWQILDLLLPDHRIVQEMSSPGGDEDVGLGKFKNPFARRKRQPMAFWSGILPAGAEGTVRIPVPEDFNGTIRVIAVQVGDGKLGVATAQTVAQHDFVIEPQAPYFVSPGDEFEIGATVANTVKGSGQEAKISLVVTPSAGLELAGPAAVDLVIPEGEDRSFRVRLRAKDELGAQDFRIEASGLDRRETAKETISLRPPQALRTTLHGGIYRPDRDGSDARRKIDGLRGLYPQRREVTASISSSPLTIGRGLVRYLEHYPYGCTEQLVSIAFPAAIYGTDAELGLRQETVDRFLGRAFRALSSRQRADGSFGLWDASSAPDPLFSVYAVHFLLEAKEARLEIPEAVYQRSLEWLKALGKQTSYRMVEHLAQSYALYLRARTGERVTAEAQSLVAELDRQWKESWRGTSIAMFLAATFRQLQMDVEARALLARPAQVWANARLPWPLSSAAVHGSIYAWLSSKHFDRDTWLSPLDTVLGVSAMIDRQEFTSFSSAFALLGLSATGEKLAEDQRERLRILAERSGAGAEPLPLLGERILKAEVPLETSALQYEGRSGEPYFYGLSETGFDRIAAEPYAAGLTIDRELRNGEGTKTDSYELQDKLEVTLFLKANETLERMAVLELVPGGFEIDLGEEGLASRKSLHPGPNAWEPEFIDVQEDRIIFFGTVPEGTATFTYRLKPLSRGRFTFAAPYAEGMYDPAKRFLGRAGTVEVK
jgi:uncharacterized protein YfaS (alpha-2-macroglobulin family)